MRCLNRCPWAYGEPNSCLNLPIVSTPLQYDDLLALLVDRGVPLCEARPRARSAAEASTDLDVLVPTDAFKRLPELLYDTCMHADLSFVIRRFTRINMKLYVLQTPLGPDLILDIWNELQARDPRDRLQCWQGLSWPDLKAHMQRRETFLELVPEVGSLVYLTHLYTKRKDLQSSAVRGRLETYRELLSDNELLSKVTNENLEPTCIGALESLAARGIYRRRRSLLPYIANRLHARYLRLFAPLRLPVFGILVGVDGAGKTALLNRASARHGLPIQRIHFRALYRGAFLYRLLTLPRGQATQEERRNYDARFLWILNLIARLRLRKLLRLAKSCGRVPVLDRYFFDFSLHDMTAGRAQRPRVAWWEPAWRLLLPRPAFAIQIWVTFEVSAWRKNELTTAQWSVYNEHIRTNLLRSSPKLLCVISNNGEIDHASHILADVFIRHVRIGVT